MTITLARRVFAEFLGTALLLAAIVGSGLAAQRRSPDDPGLPLLENSTASSASFYRCAVTTGPKISFSTNSSTGSRAAISVGSN